MNTLLPGPTLTDNVHKLMADVAAKRFEEPEEVARAAVFLCTDAVRVVHGASWRAERGIVRSIV